MKIAVFVSGKGTNLRALIKAGREGKLGAAGIALVLSDKQHAPALKHAEEAGIRTVVLEKEKGVTREQYDSLILEVLKKELIDAVVLAGFMRILGPRVVKEYDQKILNIHPSLLPSFKGGRGIEESYEHGVKITGVTVHFVDNDLDGGPIILQEAVAVDEGDSLEVLERKIHEAEHRVYPKAVALLASGRLKIKGRKVKILSE